VVNRERRLTASAVTLVSMGIGGSVLLLAGLLTQGLGRLSGQQLAILAWLVLVNTALAFTLWNRTLRTLTAVESSILNGLMVPQIAVLAVIFLDEHLTLGQWIGVLLVALGGYWVQRPPPQTG
jgi:drug/metabolite transporter (DMT)-like permease